MSETVKLKVGSIEEMGKRFIGAWHRLERGEEVRETNLTFFDWNEMVSALSPKRLELLRHVHAHPAKSIAELAKALGRDYKRVHEDVSVLEHAGLLVRVDDLIKAPYDNVQANVSLLS
jgi:predicted transcriptional regulator